MKRMKKTGQKGMALVSVLIIITLLSLLAGTVLNLSYMAYSRKLIEKKNNSNFYAAEAVLDSVKTVLQNGAIEALEDAQISESEFAVSAFKIITGYTGSNVSANGTRASNICSEAIDAVRDYLYNTVITETVLSEDGSTYVTQLKTDENYVTGGTYTYIKDAISPKTDDADSGNGGAFTIGDIICEEDCVRIEDVYVKYVNDEGYVAEITTDIVIRAPHYINVGDEPLGSYSMFAGSGVEIWSNAGSTESALGNLLYVHQEGNVYIGAMTTGDSVHTSLVIGGKVDSSGNVSNEGGEGKTIFSIDGTNVICNGDVVIANGGALFLTGGDGTETAYVQINGYIVLQDGASLFLAPNVKLCCKGIVTDIEYDGDTVITTNYTGGYQNKVEKVSQFYPVTESFMSSNSAWETSLQEYYDGEIDVEQLFSDTECMTDGITNVDTKYSNLYDGKACAGVYVLNEKYDSSGWSNRQDCEYELLYCDTLGNWTDLNGESNSQIYCDPDDYDQEQKVTYNGKDYDPEFWDIVNVPLLSYAESQRNEVEYVFSGYTCEKSSTYTEKTWSYVQSEYSGDLWNITFSNSGLTGLFDLDSDYSSRSFYIPNSTELVDADFSGKISTTLGDFYLQEYTEGGDLVNCVSFMPAYDFQLRENSENVLMFYVQIQQGVQIRIIKNGASAGIVLCSEKVIYGGNTGVMRVISLLEIAKLVTDEGVSKDIEDDGNPVHDLLEYIGSAYINNTDNKDTPYELHLVDNMFNGGISVFWKMSSNSGSSLADDNSGDDLVDYDDWNKQ